MLRTPSLRTLLIVGTVALVCLTTTVVGVQAVRLLERLADEQALARVRQAGLAAVEAVHRAGEQVATTAHLLAERPTLQRALDAGDRDVQREFLRRFAQSSGLAGCAVFGAGEPTTGGDPALPWDSVARLQLPDAGKGWATLKGPDSPRALLVAVEPVAERPGWRVAAARWLDGVLGTDQASDGVEIRIVDVRNALAGAGARARLHGRAVDESMAGAGRIDADGAFISVHPVSHGPGPVVALVEARLPTAAIDDSVQQLVNALAGAALLMGALAVVAALLLARRLGRPFETLARAAARIGRGDMDAAIPRQAGGAEAAMLAASMEDMRTRLRQLTSELRRRQADAEAVLNGIVEGVWTVDRERRITWVNAQAAAMLGVSPEQALGQFCGDVLNPLLADGTRPCEEHCPIVEARFRGSAHATEHLVLPGGRRRTVVITSAPPVEGGGGDDRRLHQAQLLRDETEVEAARRLRDTVLANVSHEFRTPLAAQLASLEMLRERLGREPAPEVDELLRSAERSTLRLTRLIDNLLESLRIEAGRDSIRRQPVQLDRVAEEAVELTAPLIEQKGQRLELRLPHPLPPISGDGPRLVQVFVNLLANANKFAPAGSSVTMAGAVAATEVSIWVEDEGPGLPEEIGERGFERFLRAVGEEPEESGMGLGLWIVHSIVTRHGGRVDARNTDAGARVTIVLPREPAGEDPRR